MTVLSHYLICLSTDLKQSSTTDVVVATEGPTPGRIYLDQDQEDGMEDDDDDDDEDDEDEMEDEDEDEEDSEDEAMEADNKVLFFDHVVDIVDQITF